MILPALSIHQPYASLVIQELKSIETRKWQVCHRGPLVIVSTRVHFNEYPVKQALGIVDLVDCRPMKDEEWEAACCEPYDGAIGWHLGNVREFRREERFEVRGMPGLFKLDVPEWICERVGLTEDYHEEYIVKPAKRLLEALKEAE